jgi:PAS domain S-box-containing protein
LFGWLAVIVSTAMAGRPAGVLALLVAGGLAARVLAFIDSGLEPAWFGAFVAGSALAIWQIGTWRRSWHRREDELRRLRSSEELLAAAFRHSPAVTSIKRESDGRFVEVNEAFTRALGLTREEAIGHTPEELSLPSAPCGEDRFRDRPVEGVAIEHPDPAGNLHHVVFSAERVAAGSDSYLIAIVDDRTEEMKAVKALQESEERFRQLAETAEEGILIANAADEIVFANAKLAGMLGYTTTEMTGRNWFELVPESHPSLEARWKEHHRGLSGQAEFWLQRRDGSRIYVNLSGSPRRDENGQCAGVVGMFTDLTEHWRAEEAIARLAVIVEFTGDSVIGLTPQGIITDWNGGATQLYGYTAQEAIGQPVWILAPAENEAREMRELGEALLAGNRVLRYKARRRRKDGQIVKVSSTLSSIVQDGRIIGFSAIARDITEAEQMEEALRRSEERFQLAVRASRDVVWDWEIATDGMWWSERFWEQFGYAPADFPAGREGWARILHPDDRWALAQPWDSGTYEYRLRRADGAWIHVRDRAHTIRDAAGTPVRMIGALSDVSEAKEAEEALRASEERYRLLFERNLAGVFCASPEGQILECNDAFWRMLGFNSREEAFEHNLRDLCVDPQEYDIASRTLLQRGQLVSHEMRWRRGDDKGITVLSTATLVPGKHDGPLLVQGTALDVTEIRHLQQALLQSQKMEAIGRLAGGVAHDFNNLLMVISSYSELLLESLTHERHRRHAEQIQKAALRASDLTGQLLAFSRKQATTPRVLNLNSVVRDIEKMLLRLIGEDIRLDTELGDSLACCRVDLTQVQQVILNLVVNARDAMPHGGRLLIETGNVELDETYCASHPEVRPGRYVMLAISDTGVGMDPETQAHLFEPFFTTKEIGKGTGLGLSTVYGIVKQNRGSVSVYSERGRGAAFKIYLPSLETAAENSTEPAATAGFATGSGTVLLVEDEPALREAAAEHLRSLGYEVLDVPDGEHALRVAQDFPQRIDLLLTDVIMPGLGGMELGLRIRRLRPEVRVLYMSGYSDSAVLQDLATKPPGHFLQKPFSFRVLSSTVTELLKQPLAAGGGDEYPAFSPGTPQDPSLGLQ